MLRSHASKRLGFSSNPCFKLKEFKKPNILFKFSLHELKKGTYALDKHEHFAQKSLLVSMFHIQGKW